MSIKLLPASVSPVEPSQATDETTSLVPLTRRAIAMRAGQSSPVPSADGFAWSSSTRQSQVRFIDGTPVEDPQSNETGQRAWEYPEYLSGWAWSRSIESTAVAHYLSYATDAASGSGRLIDLYA